VVAVDDTPSVEIMKIHEMPKQADIGHVLDVVDDMPDDKLANMGHFVYVVDNTPY